MWLITVYGVKHNDYSITNEHSQWLLVNQSESYPDDVFGYWQLLKVRGMWKILKFIRWPK